MKIRKGKNAESRLEDRRKAWDSKSAKHKEATHRPGSLNHTKG